MSILTPLIHDPIALLKNDHDMVRDLFKELEKVPQNENEKRETVFRELQKEWTLHTAVEEDIFYPMIRDATETKNLVLDAYGEHAKIKELFTVLDESAKFTAEWMIQLKVLRASVEHHIQKEEQELLKKAKGILDNDELEALGTQMRVRKESIMGVL